MKTIEIHAQEARDRSTSECVTFSRVPKLFLCFYKRASKINFALNLCVCD